LNDPSPASGADADLGAYCRQVEDFLTKTNGGHLVRIVGPAFDLVRRWAQSGVPMSVVLEGIRSKAARHQAGGSRRPLRLEFCATDVDETFTRWRRAIGMPAEMRAGVDGSSGDEPATGTARHARLPSLPRHLDRIMERLTGAANRVDVSEAFRDAVNRALGDISALRDLAAGARGSARADAIAQLARVERQLLDDVRDTLDPSVQDELRAGAAADVAAFQSRLAPDAWGRSVAIGVDRQIRERFGLPVMDPEA
jgi:hypothetical protein